MGPDDNDLNLLLFEDFESNLDGWTGRQGMHNGQIVADPADPDNSVVYFTVPVAAGDMFSEEITVDASETFRLTFDYLGLAREGSTPDDHGGFIGIADEIPGNHFWLAGTDPNQAVVHLIDDGTWHSYTIDFVLEDHMVPLDDGIRVMLEDGEVQPGVPMDAYFDNVRLRRVTF